MLILKFSEKIRLVLGFLTRLPVRAPDGGGRGGELAGAMALFPLAGVVAGAASGTVLAAGTYLGFSGLMAGLLAVAAGIAITGGLHEDGLADVADGFGGGWTVQRKLEIMRDSTVGTYGVLALVIITGLKAGGLGALADGGLRNWDLVAIAIAAGAMSRAMMVVLLFLLAPARRDGRSVEAGRPAFATTASATGLALAICAGCLVPVFGISAALGICASAIAGLVFMHMLAFRHIGGQTGDVAGATQQICEVALVLAAVLAAN